MKPEQRLIEPLASCIIVAQSAISALQAAARLVQSECNHPRVAEKSWREGFLFVHYARRICLSCGLEEEGSRWSGGSTWSRADYKEPERLGNTPGRDIMEVDEATFYSYRIPYTPVEILD